MGTPPAALAFSTDNCTIGRAMAVLGERWTFVVVREVANGIRRFDDMRRHTKMPRQVLTDRLALLLEHDILRRVAYREEGQRERHEYRLTDKGFELFPLMLAVAEWGDRYYADDDGAPVEFAHRDCGAALTLAVHCDQGHVVAAARDIVSRPGPGIRPFVA